jgi:hypothetical protein
MDQENVPMAVRQDRIVHSDARTTTRYSHAVSEDGRRFAARLGALLMPEIPVMTTGSGLILVPIGAKLSGENGCK